MTSTADLLTMPVAGSDLGLGAALREAGLPTDDLLEGGRAFFAYAASDGATVGFGGVEHLGEHALLRSLAVLPALRGQGFGRQILMDLIKRAAAGGARRAWLLTTTATPFFKSAGFVLAERAAAPAPILATRQASTLCSATALLLTRPINS